MLWVGSVPLLIAAMACVLGAVILAVGASKARIRVEMVLLISAPLLTLLGLIAYMSYRTGQARYHLALSRQESTALLTVRRSLAESEARLRVTLRSIGDGVIATDLRGRVTFINPVAQQLTGWSEKGVGRPLAKVYHLIDGVTRQPIQDPVGRVIHQGTIMGLAKVTVLVSRDGREHAISESASPIRQADGKIAGVVMVFRDIGEEHRKAEALRHSEQRYRNLFNSMTEGFALHEIICDKKGRPCDYRFTEVNPAFEKTTGLRVSQVVGKTVREVLPGIEPFWIETYGRVALEGEPVQFQHYSKELDRHFEVIAFCPRKGYFAALFMDISQRTRVQEALAREQNLLRSLMDNVPDKIYFKDRESRFVRINKALADSFGLADPAEAVNKTDFDFFTLEHAQQARADEDRVMETGQPMQAKDEKETWPDGHVTWVSTTKVPLRDADGEIIGTFGISRDITERRSIEEQLRQAQKMEAVGKLAGGVAHDFNNQLTIIKGYCDLLLRGKPDKKTIGESLKEIRGAAERAAQLSSQLLAFSRKQVLRAEVVDLNQVLAQMANPLAQMIGEDMFLSVVPDSQLGRVRADRIQVQQAIMNMVVNARDAMPEGGTLTIETANVDLESGRADLPADIAPGPYVLLSIRDTGVGMDAVTAEQVFEPFFTTKPVGEGTGLGLAMVYGFVKQSGGVVQVDSEPVRGTTFRVFLPRVDAPVTQAAASETDGEPVPTGDETVLVAEDDEGVRRVLVRTLRQCGYTVLEAAGPTEALALVDGQDRGIQLLVTDVVMPDMSGPQLAEKLLAEHSDLKVLYISGYAGDAIADRGIVDTDVNFLSKPFTSEQLVRAVRQVLDTPQ